MPQHPDSRYYAQHITPALAFLRLVRTALADHASAICFNPDGPTQDAPAVRVGLSVNADRRARVLAACERLGLTVTPHGRSHITVTPADPAVDPAAAAAAADAVLLVRQLSAMGCWGDRGPAGTDDATLVLDGSHMSPSWRALPGGADLWDDGGADDAHAYGDLSDAWCDVLGIYWSDGCLWLAGESAADALPTAPAPAGPSDPPATGDVPTMTIPDDTPAGTPVARGRVDYATDSGADLRDGQLPVAHLVDGVTYRTTRGVSAADLAAAVALAASVHTLPGQPAALLSLDDDHAHAHGLGAFALDTLAVHDGRLLAVVATVGGPWGGGIVALRDGVTDATARALAAAVDGWIGALSDALAGA